MPTDLTGTPTSLGIGTYNVDADAPSGLGFNAAMAQIDALIAARVSKPAGAVSGDVPVWNGSTWVRPSGTPDATKFLRGDGTWSTVALTYRKSTAKQVVNTVTETDLLNGEITVGAGVLGTTGVLRLTAWGDWKQNSGGTSNGPDFGVKLGGTTLFHWTTTGNLFSAGNSATRLPWRADIVIQNAGATNAQTATVRAFLTGPTAGSAGNGVAATNFSVGEGIGVGVWGTTSGEVWNDGFNTSAVDTTAATALVFSATNAVANVNYDVTLKGALVEIL